MKSRAIIIMGVSGCGKTTLAQLLARQLDCPFIEGDALHDTACIAKMARGEPLNDDDRWPWLDRIGTALSQVTAENGVVVAACSALKQVYRERLRKAIAVPASFILLDAPYAELTQRLAQRTEHFMPVSLLASQLATLERPLSGETALTLDARLAPQALCKASLDWLS
jgi:gluconokinase